MRARYGKELVAGVQLLLEERRGRELGEVSLVKEVLAMTFPKSLVEAGCVASDTFPLRRLGRGYHIPAGDCIAEKLGLLRHHEGFSAVVVFVVDGESRSVSLG